MILENRIQNWMVSILKTTIVCLLGVTLLTGCDDGEEEGADGKYSFTNESSHTVTLYTAGFVGWDGTNFDETTRRIPPGGKATVKGTLIGDTYRLSYDYEPEDKVKDNQVKKDRVVFTDRVE